jgi:hypothetical protein
MAKQLIAGCLPVVEVAGIVRDYCDAKDMPLMVCNFYFVAHEPRHTLTPYFLRYGRFAEDIILVVT